MNREALVKAAIQNLEGNVFERFSYVLLSRNLYPGLNPTSQSGDLGEDAHTEYSTLFLHNGKWISLATSKEHGWGKVKKDCDRCKQTGREIDILVFVTAGNPRNTTVDKWKIDVKKIYGWDLEVRAITFLVPYAAGPVFEDVVDDYLNIPPRGGDFIKNIENKFEEETRHAIRNISLEIPGLLTSLPRQEIQYIEEQIDLGKSVLLTGEAGSGKSGIARRLFEQATEKGVPVLFLDVRRLRNIINITDLKNHFDLNDSLKNAIVRLAKKKGCRVIVDQLDNSIGLPVSGVIFDLVQIITGQTGVSIIVISRKREAHEVRFLDKLISQSNMVELRSNPLAPNVVREVLNELGLKKPSSQLVAIGENLLNLEMVGRILQSRKDADISGVDSEIDLWEEYIAIIRDREGDSGDHIIGEAIKLSKQGLQAKSGSFTLEFSKTYEQKRLESWKIIVCDSGLIYQFHHEKFQDYLYAFDAAERGLSQQQIIDELGDFYRVRNILLFIQEIVHRKYPAKATNYLREAWNV